MNTETANAIKFEKHTFTESETTYHKAATATGDKIHVALKTVRTVADEFRPLGQTSTMLSCSTAISYQFTIATNEMTNADWDEVTCSKCKPSLKLQGGAA